MLYPRELRGMPLWRSFATVALLVVPLCQAYGQSPQPVSQYHVINTGCNSCKYGVLGAPPPPSQADILPPPQAIPPENVPMEGAVPADPAFSEMLHAVPMPELPYDPGCGEAKCFPGRKPCCPTGTGTFARFFHGVHDCLCCPDPCYEPRWVPAANAGIFLDFARPRSMTRFRWNHGENLILPDRNEYFWGAIGGPGPGLPETGLDYDELTIYLETASDNFSLFIETPYRNNDPDINFGSGGFGDLRFGTKSLLVDCELLQFTFQFTTTVPTGRSGNGLGTGHTSLEPALLASLKLAPDTYMQAQLAEWIPLGGTPGVQGSLLRYNFAFNRVMYRPLPDTDLIGILEFGGFAFQAGGFTDPVSGLVLPSNEDGYFYLGPGLRLSVCDKLDVGFGASFALTDQHFADQIYRIELRYFY